MNVKAFPTYSLALMLLGSTCVLASTSARADDDDAENYTIEEVQACSGDAMRLCRDALPDVHKIETCMVSKKAELSKACQAMFVAGRKR